MLKILGIISKGIGSLFKTLGDGVSHLAYASMMMTYMTVNLATVSASVIHELTVLSLQGMKGFGQLLGLIPLDPVVPMPTAPSPESVLADADAEVGMSTPAANSATPGDLASTVKAYAEASFRERALMDLGWLDGDQMRWLFGLSGEQLDAISRAPISEVERALSGKHHRIADVPAYRPDDAEVADVRDDIDLGYAYHPRMSMAA